MSSEAFLDVAAAIGRRIVAEAVWHQRRCSWVGAAEPAKRSRPEVRPVGPLLYDGTAGIALFLAQLAAATGDPSLRRTALGAIRHAVSRELPGHGLYAGAPGVAWAAARVAALLDAEEATAAARSLLVAPVPASGPDVRAGAAGTVLALLGVAAALDDPSLVAVAAAVGESLLAGVPARLPDGVPDGALGIAWALRELSMATGDTRFAAGARDALGQRPDHRGRTCAPVADARGTWCSSQAGRVVVTSARDCPDADMVLRGVREDLGARLPYAFDDLSLCHGLTGPAFILLSSGERDIPMALGRAALERHGPRNDWPCGPYGPSPSLFRGLGGIGWFFLALGNSDAPSPFVVSCAVDRTC